MKTTKEINRKHAAEVYQEHKKRLNKPELDIQQIVNNDVSKLNKWISEHPRPKTEYQWKILKVGDNILRY